MSGDVSDEALAEAMVKVSVSKGLAFSQEERDAFAAVAAVLIQTKPEGAGLPAAQVRPREVMMVTMISKCLVDKAVAKYVQFVKTIGEYDLTVASLYEPRAALMSKLGGKWKANYQVCGADSEGRSIMWIGSATPSLLSEEQVVVHSGVMYWMAVHSDLTTLRDGCTFVIDTSKQNGIPKVGNERKLQKTWQALPLRPQHLFIVGASFTKRLFINALIKFASIFSNSKVLARIRFTEMDAVREVVPAKSMPNELGGAEREEVGEWVMRRLSALEE